MHYFVVGRVVGRGVTPRSERGVADGEDASASPRTASICGCVCDMSGREEHVYCVWSFSSSSTFLFSFKHFTAPHLFCKLTLHFNHPQSHSNK